MHNYSLMNNANRLLLISDSRPCAVTQAEGQTCAHARAHTSPFMVQIVNSYEGFNLHVLSFLWGKKVVK